MKTVHFSKGVVAGLAATAIIFSACSKSEKVSDSGESKATPEKPEPPKKEEPPTTPKKVTTPPVTPPPKPPAPPVVSAGGGSVARQMNGYWAPNKESLIAVMKKEAPPGTDEAQMMAMIMPMVEQMADKIAISLNDGTAIAISPEGEEKSTYKVLSTNAATGAFTVEMTEADGTVDTGEGMVKGDMMTMTRDGVEMRMDRISKGEFEKRQQALAEFKKQLEGIGQPGGEIPGGILPPETTDALNNLKKEIEKSLSPEQLEQLQKQLEGGLPPEAREALEKLKSGGAPPATPVPGSR